MHNHFWTNLLLYNLPPSNLQPVRDPAYNQFELHLFTLSISFALEVVVIVDQLIYLKARFYNSNCSNPNGSASPFEEDLLDDTKLYFAAIAPSSRRNALPCLARHNNLDKFGYLKERTPASTKYIKEDFRTMTKFCIELFSQAQASCRKPKGH